MSARILLFTGGAQPAPDRRVIAIDSFRPEARLGAEARYLLRRMRGLERLLRAKASEARALDRIVCARPRR